MTEIVCACVCACVRVCVCACVRVCVRVCVNIDVFLTLLYYHDQDSKSSYTVMIDSHIVLLCIQLLFLTMSYTTQQLLDENTPIAYPKIINVGAYSIIILICMDVFILFVDDHRIALHEIYLEFS